MDKLFKILGFLFFISLSNAQIDPEPLRVNAGDLGWIQGLTSRHKMNQEPLLPFLGKDYLKELS